jgi:hypothetical protein
MSEDALLTGAARADQPVVRRRQDRRHQALPGLPPAIWLRLHFRHADQPLRPRRQFRPEDEPRHPRPDAPHRRGQADRAPTVEIWGTGEPRREFLHVDDLADAVVFLLESYSGEEHVNVGTGIDVTIAELARLIADVVGYTGEFAFDTSKPDGTPRKLLDVSRLTALGWRARTGLRDGLAETHAWFRFHFDERFFDREPPVFLDGYWQSERYFGRVEDEIRATFARPASPSRAYEEMRHEVEAAGNAVSVHVRRGDYVTGKAAGKMAGSCTPGYYARAVALMARLVPGATFFVFSDEPEEAGRMLAFADPVVVAGPGDRPAEDMALMAACRHHIIANSSFSWWGAWLDPSPKKTVIAPRLWFAPAYLRKTYTFDLYDPDWIAVG